MNNFYILVPIYNFELFLDECLVSILEQTYDNWFCFLFDDGSTDNSSYICQQYVKKSNKFKHIKLDKKNHGPAYSKWYGIQEIRKVCKDEDIMIIIDGDDYLINKDAFSIINNIYIKTKCMATFGSYKGKFDNMKYNVNMKSYSRKIWFYMPPRSCKCSLLQKFTENDFKYKNREWLQKATDAAFFCNIIEWVGIHNVQYVKDILYLYREHPNNTYKKNKDINKKHTYYVINKKL